ncbi:hypothetical protein FOL46_009012, partial [Perkinsus olseni]
MSNVLREERITFTAPQNDAHQLVGTLWSPSTPPTSPPEWVVILCHGLMGDRQSSLSKSIAYVLTTQLGLPTFRFDFTGNGESEGEWDYGNYEQEAAELEAAVRTLEERRKLKTLATIGHSRGATVVCLQCGNSSYTKISLVVSLSGRYDMTHKPNRFTDEEKHQLDTLGYCDWYRPRHDGSMRKYRWKKSSIERIMAMDTRKMTEDCARRGSKLMFVQARDDPVSFVTALGVCSFRFDFSGNGDSAGEWDCGDYHQEVLEIDAAVRMLRDDEGLKTICLVGHSKGGTVVSMYAGANEVATRVPLIVSISGRFDLSAKPDDRFSASDVESLETVGYCDTVRGQKTFRWRKESLQRMSAIDMIPIVQNCSRKEDVSMLFIHAEGDDVGLFAMALVLVRRCKYPIYCYRGFSAFTYVSYDGEAGGFTKRLQKGFSNASTLAFESIDPFRRDWTK